ncbi:glycosyltransferase [Desulforhabdus amnigena]|uniref:glycosyltransferase n=1 Tax=Desulforhabdus amnigena TaxID=40218 RepID=UPI0024921441|nr:glycosyltransferase [Desulforhabdus amnigena]
MRPKIIYLFPAISFGGAERINLNFLEHVRRDSFNIQPVVLVRPWEKDNHITKRLVELDYRLLEIPVALTPSQQQKDRFRLLRALRLFLQELLHDSVQLIHSHGYFADFLAFFASCSQKIPCISTCHGFISTDAKLRFYNKVDMLLLNGFDCIIAVSEALRVQLIGHIIHPGRIVTVPNTPAIPSPKPRPAQDRLQHNVLDIVANDILLGYVGRLSEEKGLPILISAFRRVQTLHAHVKLVLVGDGPLRKSLKKMVDELGLADSVIFAGFQESVEPWLYLMDIFVLPSRMEGTPLSLLEAMAVGLPCIATDVGGVSKIMTHEKDGLLIESDSIFALENAIMHLIKQPKLRTELGKNARHTIETKFSIKQWARDIEILYHSIISRHTNH